MEEGERDPEEPRAHLEIDEKQEADENVDGLWALGMSFLAACDTAALQQTRDRRTTHAPASCNTRCVPPC